MSQQFWPCELPFQPMPAEIQFLEAAVKKGYRAYLSGISDFGAIAKSGRCGEIIVRGRTRRELWLCSADKRDLSAFVDSFESAAEALLKWLDGASVDEVLADLKEHLVVMAGMKTSYRVYSDEASRVAN
jgi:hypothetical protein